MSLPLAKHTSFESLLIRGVVMAKCPLRHGSFRWVTQTSWRVKLRLPMLLWTKPLFVHSWWPSSLPWFAHGLIGITDSCLQRQPVFVIFAWSNGVVCSIAITLSKFKLDDSLCCIKYFYFTLTRVYVYCESYDLQ